MTAHRSRMNTPPEAPRSKQSSGKHRIELPDATAVPCPDCHAIAGEPCLGLANAHHSARFTLAAERRAKPGA